MRLGKMTLGAVSPESPALMNPEPLSMTTSTFFFPDL